MTRVKICGLRDVESALVAAKAGADFLGMVFAESKRQVSPQQCHDIVEAVAAERRQSGFAQFDGPVRGEVPARSWFGAWQEAIDDALPRWRPLLVGVFADQPIDQVNEIAEAAGLDLVQLSGGESWDDAARVVRPVIKAVHIGDGALAADLADTIEPGRAAAIILDTASATARGGTGLAFDWDVAAGLRERYPFLLAGGLTPETVAAAVEQVDPWAVDVSSGVETGGAKDHEKIRAFIRAAKGVRSGR